MNWFTYSSIDNNLKTYNTREVDCLKCEETLVTRDYEETFKMLTEANDYDDEDDLDYDIFRIEYMREKCENLIKIVNKVSEPATEKQLAYIRRLGGEPDKEMFMSSPHIRVMTKREASREIERLKNLPKSESETGGEE